jgi:hypothetical protein
LFLGVECTFPRREQLLDIPPLVVRELEVADQPAGLRRVVVLDGRLEVLAERVRLPELPAEPAKQADLRGFHCPHSTAGPRVSAPSALSFWVKNPASRRTAPTARNDSARVIELNWDRS